MDEFPISLLRPTTRNRLDPLQQYASIGHDTLSYAYSYEHRAALAFHAQDEAGWRTVLVGMNDWSSLPNGALVRLSAPITEKAAKLLIRTANLDVRQGRLFDPPSQ